MQEWVTVIIVLLILAILLDGVRRMRINQRDKIRMSRSIHKQTASESGKDKYTSELPNGGARVVAYREPPQPQARAVRKSPAVETPKRRSPEQTRLNLDEAVPLLMESIQDDVLLNDHQDMPVVAKNPERHERRIDDRRRIEPTFSALDDDDLNGADQQPYARQSTQATYAAATPQDAMTQPLDDYDESEDDHRLTDEQEFSRDEDDLYDDEGYTADDYDEEEYVDEDYDEDEDYENDEDYPEDEDELLAKDQPAAEPEEVLIINVMAMKGEMFQGAALLDTILKCGMRYGDMNIFHRYIDTKGEGALLFSMANMVKPGTFDLDAMDQFETPGVSLFMTLPIKADSMQSFDLMADTARTIAETLGGELKDEQRSVMTRQTLEHCRQRIRDYELKKLSRGRQ